MLGISVSRRRQREEVAGVVVVVSVVSSAKDEHEEKAGVVVGVDASDMVWIGLVVCFWMMSNDVSVLVLSGR